MEESSFKADPSRFVVGVFFFLCHVISYADRFNITVALLHMANEYHYSLLMQGHILASFFYGYLVTQFLGGYLSSASSSIGPKYALVYACAAWSAVTVLTPLCSDASVWMLIAARIFVGLAEGIYIPASVGLIAMWFPADERATISSVQAVGQSLGAALAMACAPIAAQNWRLVFYGFGVIGLVWSVAFWTFGPDKKKSDDATYGSVNTEFDKTCHHSEATYSSILSNSAFWAIASAHVAYNWSWYIQLSWLPKYLVQMYDVGPDQVGNFAIWPYLAASVMLVLWSQLVDYCLRTKIVPLRRARATSQCMSTVGPVCAWVVLVATTKHLDVFAAAWLLTIGVALQTAAMSGFYPNMVDIGGALNGPRIAAASNTLATLPGIFGNIAVGALLEGFGADSGWLAVFCTMIVAQCLGLMMFLTFARTDQATF